MAEDCKSWLDRQHFDGRTPDLNSTDAWTGQYTGSQNQLPSYIYPCPATVAAGPDFMLSSLTKPPQPNFDQCEPLGWFYWLSTFRQTMFPPSNSVLKEHLSVESPVTSKEVNNHNAGQQFHRKQLLLFDQTGDQTTMIYSSGVGAPPVHCLPRWKEKQAEAAIFCPQQDGSNTGNADRLLTDCFVDISEFDADHGSEMHEDTEELNALMYSDGDSDGDGDDDEDEVTSTGHSPSTSTIIDKLNGFAEVIEEVASSDEEPTKRQKLFNGGNGIAFKDDLITASHGIFSVDEDTESCYCSAEMCNSRKTLSLSGKKRARKDCVREKVRTLQSMIPCGNGATPIEVIDEAINFLLSLKLKARALGLDATT